MGTVVRALTRRKVIAIAIGVLLAGAPLLAFDFWLSRLVNEQGQEEAATSAKRAITLAETRVAMVVATLDRLAKSGVDSCRPENIETMRRATFDTIPTKEIAIVGPDGRRLCTDLGLPLGKRRILSSQPLAGVDGYALDVLQLPNGERAVQIRRGVGDGSNGLAALVPATLFLPQVATQGGPFSAYARIVTDHGFLIGQLGAPPTGPPTATFTAKANSDRFGFTADIAMPRSRVMATHAGFERLGMIATAAVVLILIAFAVLIPRPAHDNPVTEIERALAAGEFVPYYQPIVDIRSGQLRGAEVLVRWKKPDGSLVLPGAFIPLAESSGLIRDMTRDLMKRVCAEAGRALGSRPALKISFNFAGQLFRDQTIVKDVRAVFAGTPIKLSQVVLEVTERDPIENFTATRQTIAALQGLGVRIAIDDVGTGHSGLSYMLKLGVDIIKIDKMFVDAIGTDRNSTTIVETLIDLAHNMRMDVVAEGVENFEQVMHLRELGVRSAQGYVFAPPLPGNSFLKLVEAIDPLPERADTTPHYETVRHRVATA
jgi:sensor c-di-GMP phosphodiesterase-like protein